MGESRNPFTSRQPGIHPAAKHHSSRSPLPGRTPLLLTGAFVNTVCVSVLNTHFLGE